MRIKRLFSRNNRPKKAKTVKAKQQLSWHDWHRHPFAIPAVTFMVLFFVACAAFITSSGETIGANDSRVVHLYVDGQSRTIPTRAKTVGEVLQRAGIELNEGDLAEPAIDSPIIDQDFNINIYRARPVTIVDRGTKIITKVTETEPAQMAKKAGVSLYPEDKVQIAKPDEALKQGVIGAAIVIDRATPVYINLYGTSIPVRTHAKTVGELLDEKNVKPLQGDSLQPSRETPLVENAQVFLISMGKKIASVEEVIPAPEERISDPNVPAGTTKVTEAGSPGKKIVTYEIVLQNDKEVSRRQIQEVVALQPVKKVISQGTKIVISNPSANVALGQQIAAQMGYADQFHCIYQIFERESRWNHLAGNPSGAYGIPQALPGSKMGPGWQSDPAVQIRWGIGYMKNRYGSPCGAWQHWQLHHNY